MPRMIIPIVEGNGDLAAVPILVRRILIEIFGTTEWDAGAPKRAKSLSVLRRDLEKYIRYAELETDSAGILIVLDLDDGCPWQEAQSLAASIRKLPHHLPIAIVLACKEYEAWFLASIETFSGRYSLPDGMIAPPDVERIRGAKEWITDHMVEGKIYKETIHQPAWSAQMNLSLAANRSRSFRRLIHAVEELLRAEISPDRVTPSINAV